MTSRWDYGAWHPRTRREFWRSQRKKWNFANWMRNNPTYGEAAAWKLFQRLNYQYPDFIWRRQIVVFGVIPDFYCEHLRVAVEIDGAVHQGREEEDKRKDLYLEKRGIRVLRVPNAMVIHSPRLFLEKIKEVSER